MVNYRKSSRKTRGQKRGSARRRRRATTVRHRRRLHIQSGG